MQRIQGRTVSKKNAAIFLGGGFADVQSAQASYRLSLLVDLLTRMVPCPFLGETLA